MPSPRPTPTVLKLIKGNPGRRKLNKREPTPKRVIPSCPEYLNDVAKVAWGRLSVILDRMGVLTEADALALERMCDCYADIMACKKLIALHGRTYQTDSEGGILHKTNPAVTQLRAAEAMLKAYMIEFGLTPAARSKVQVADDGEESADPLSTYFG